MTPDNLKQWRTERNLTQQEAADLIGYSVKSWRQWEYGERKIHKSIEILLNLLNLPVDNMPQ